MLGTRLKKLQVATYPCDSNPEGVRRDAPPAPCCSRTCFGAFGNCLWLRSIRERTFNALLGSSRMAVLGGLVGVFDVRRTLCLLCLTHLLSHDALAMT